MHTHRVHALRDPRQDPGLSSYMVPALTRPLFLLRVLVSCLAPLSSSELANYGAIRELALYETAGAAVVAFRNHADAVKVGRSVRVGVHVVQCAVRAEAPPCSRRPPCSDSDPSARPRRPPPLLPPPSSRPPQSCRR